MATRRTESGSFLVSHLTSYEFVNMFKRQKGRKKFYLFFDDRPKRVNKDVWKQFGRTTQLIFEDTAPGFLITTHLRTVAPGKRQPTPFNQFSVFKFVYDGNSRHERRLVATLEDAERLHDEFVAEARAITDHRISDFLALGERALPLDEEALHSFKYKMMVDWLESHCPTAKIVRFDMVGAYCSFPTIEDAVIFKMNWSDLVQSSSGVFERA